MKRLNHWLLGAALIAGLVGYCSKPANALVSNQTVQTTTGLGNGVTTNYTISFDFRDNTQVVVTQIDSSTTPPTSTVIAQGGGAGKFTVTGGNPGTTVVMGTAPSATQYEVISRSIPITQTTHFDPAAAFPTTNTELTLDQQTLITQNLNQAVTQKVGLNPYSSASPTPTIPDPIADNLLLYDHTPRNMTVWPGGSLASGDFPYWNGSTWAKGAWSSAGIAAMLNAGGGVLAGSGGGTGVNNGGTLTWGSNNLTFTLAGTTNLILPSGTVNLAANPMTTSGDTTYGGASGVVTRLAGDATNVDVFFSQKSIAGVAQPPAWKTSTGTGSVVLGTSPTLVTPALGTPSALVGTNITGTAAGLTVGAVSAGAVTNAMLANMANNTVKGNISGGGVPADITLSASTTGNSVAQRDANGKGVFTSALNGYATAATAAGTTTLNSGSPRTQFFTGVTTQSLVLPNATTLALGEQYEVHNDSTGIVTVKDNGANTIYAIPGCPSSPCSATIFTATNIGSANGTWDAAAGGGVTQLTTKGDILSYSTTPTRHGVPGDYGDMVPDTGATDGWRNITHAQRQMGKPGKNYVQYSDLENNATTGWTATGCATLTNGLPTCVGSGGTAFSSANGGRAKGANTNSPAIDSSSAIAGTYALNYATTGAGVIGDGYVSSLYTIDKADQAKVLSYKLYYKVASGTPVMAGTSTDTYAVAIYDPVNNAFLGTNGVFSFIQSTGVGIAQGTFQTASNTTSVQIFVYSPVAPTGTSSLLLDDFYIGPQISTYGPAMSDWTAFTPTGTWVSNTTYTGFWRRHGDSIDLQYQLALTGAPTSATLVLNTPSGVTLDTTKLGSNNTFFSIGTLRGVGAAHGFAGLVEINNSTSIAPLYLLDGFTTSIMNSAVITQAAPYTFANGDSINIFAYDLPVSGWSSNSSQSAESDTRVAAVNGVFQLATGTITSSFNIAKMVANKDTHGGYNATTGLYTVPVTGWYNVTATLDWAANYTAGNTAAVQIGRNGSGGSDAVYSYLNVPRTANTDYGITAAGSIFCNAGDTLGVYTLSTQAGTFSTSSSGNFFSFIRQSGPAVVTATETVAASYSQYSNSGAIGSNTTVLFTTKDTDTHNAMASGVWTCPAAGTYQITANFGWLASATTAGVLTNLVKNGGAVRSGWNHSAPTNARTNGGSISGLLKLVPGDALSLQVSAGFGGATYQSGTDSYFQIVRVGN